MDMRICSRGRVPRGLLAVCAGVLTLALSSPPPVNPKVEAKSKDADSGLKTSGPVGGVLKPVDGQALVSLFRTLVGVREQPMGSNRGFRVDEFNRSAGADLGSPWCAAVAHWGYAELGAADRPGAYSPSWFRASRRVSQSKVLAGDVALVWFTSMGRYAHTIACVEKPIFSAGRVVQVQTLEGNTNAQNSREGDQFARRIRSADTLTFVRWNPR